MADYVIKQGDTYPPVTAQMVDANGLAVDLSGATVQIHIKLRGALLFNRNCTITDAANGWVTYAWQVGDTDIASTSATMEFRVIFSNGRIASFPDDRELDLQITRNLTS